jgi:hypothetical protein
VFPVNFLTLGNGPLRTGLEIPASAKAQAGVCNHLQSSETRDRAAFTKGSGGGKRDPTNNVRTNPTSNRLTKFSPYIASKNLNFL